MATPTHSPHVVLARCGEGFSLRIYEKRPGARAPAPGNEKRAASASAPAHGWAGDVSSFLTPTQALTRNVSRPLGARQRRQQSTTAFLLGLDRLAQSNSASGPGCAFGTAVGSRVPRSRLNVDQKHVTEQLFVRLLLSRAQNEL